MAVSIWLQGLGIQCWNDRIDHRRGRNGRLSLGWFYPGQDAPFQVKDLLEPTHLLAIDD